MGSGMNEVEVLAGEVDIHGSNVEGFGDVIDLSMDDLNEYSQMGEIVQAEITEQILRPAELQSVLYSKIIKSDRPDVEDQIRGMIKSLGIDLGNVPHSSDMFLLMEYIVGRYFLYEGALAGGADRTSAGGEFEKDIHAKCIKGVRAIANGDSVLQRYLWEEVLVPFSKALQFVGTLQYGEEHNAEYLEDTLLNMGDAEKRLYDAIKGPLLCIRKRIPVCESLTFIGASTVSVIVQQAAQMLRYLSSRDSDLKGAANVRDYAIYRSAVLSNDTLRNIIFLHHAMHETNDNIIQFITKRCMVQLLSAQGGSVTQSQMKATYRGLEPVVRDIVNTTVVTFKDSKLEELYDKMAVYIRELDLCSDEMINKQSHASKTTFGWFTSIYGSTACVIDDFETAVMQEGITTASRMTVFNAKLNISQAEFVWHAYAIYVNQQRKRLDLNLIDKVHVTNADSSMEEVLVECACGQKVYVNGLLTEFNIPSNDESGRASADIDFSHPGVRTSFSGFVYHDIARCNCGRCYAFKDVDYSLAHDIALEYRKNIETPIVRSYKGFGALNFQYYMDAAADKALQFSFDNIIMMETNARENFEADYSNVADLCSDFLLKLESRLNLIAAEAGKKVDDSQGMRSSISEEVLRVLSLKYKMYLFWLLNSSSVTKFKGDMLIDSALKYFYPVAQYIGLLDKYKKKWRSNINA